MTPSEPLAPIVLRRDGPDRLAIEWNDGHHSVYTWKHLRANCPCAGCREERQQPPDPFRVLKPAELAPLAPVRMPPVGRYAYKIVWNDGHDTRHLHPGKPAALCQCPECSKRDEPRLQRDRSRSQTSRLIGQDLTMHPPGGAAEDSRCRTSSTSWPSPAARAASANRPWPPTSPWPCRCTASASA